MVITPLTLTLRSKSAEKQYDQTPLVCHEVEVVGGSFHAGEGFDYTFTGSRTDVGTSANAFGYTAQSGTGLNDYAITVETGTLTVTPASITSVELGVTVVHSKLGHYLTGGYFDIMVTRNFD